TRPPSTPEPVAAPPGVEPESPDVAVSPVRVDTFPPDSIRTLVSRLDLARYKETVRGLTQFGDRRQGTARNRAAVDWIESQLKSYGCTTERITYQYAGRQLRLPGDTTRPRPRPAPTGPRTIPKGFRGRT